MFIKIKINLFFFKKGKYLIEEDNIRTYYCSQCIIDFYQRNTKEKAIIMKDISSLEENQKSPPELKSLLNKMKEIKEDFTNNFIEIQEFFENKIKNTTENFDKIYEILAEIKSKNLNFFIESHKNSAIEINKVIEKIDKKIGNIENGFFSETDFQESSCLIDFQKNFFEKKGISKNICDCNYLTEKTNRILLEIKNNVKNEDFFQNSNKSFNKVNSPPIVNSPNDERNNNNKNCENNIKRIFFSNTKNNKENFIKKQKKSFIIFNQVKSPNSKIQEEEIMKKSLSAEKLTNLEISIKSNNTEESFQKYFEKKQENFIHILKPQKKTQSKKQEENSNFFKFLITEGTEKSQKPSPQFKAI